MRMMKCMKPRPNRQKGEGNEVTDRTPPEIDVLADALAGWIALQDEDPTAKECVKYLLLEFAAEIKRGAIEG